MLCHFTKCYDNWVKLNWLIKTYVINKCGKFCLKIFLHYIYIAIFALGYLNCCTLYMYIYICICICICICIYTVFRKKTSTFLNIQIFFASSDVNRTSVKVLLQQWDLPLTINISLKWMWVKKLRRKTLAQDGFDRKWWRKDTDPNISERSLTFLIFAVGWALCGQPQPERESLMPLLSLSPLSGLTH